MTWAPRARFQVPTARCGPSRPGTSQYRNRALQNPTRRAGSGAAAVGASMTATCSSDAPHWIGRQRGVPHYFASGSRFTSLSTISGSRRPDPSSAERLPPSSTPSAPALYNT